MTSQKKSVFITTDKKGRSINKSSGEDGIAIIKPRFAGLAVLSILAWIAFSIYPPMDDDRYYFTISMFTSGSLAAFQLRHSRTNQNPIQGGSSAIFVLIWLGVFSFAEGSTKVELYNYALTIRQLEFIVLLPLAFIWVLPYNEEKFFGIIESEPSDKLHAAWRVSVLFLILINIINFGNEWYWKPMEFLILIPMIYETVKLNQNRQDKLPVLTLFIQTEIAEKFAVPFSMLKSVFFIMVVFIFGILDSRLWLIVILGYFAAGFIWAVISIIPPDMKSGSETSINDLSDDVQEKILSRRKRHEKRKQRRSKSNKSIEAEMKLIDVAFSEPREENEYEATVIDDQPTDGSELAVASKDLSTSHQDGSIQVKAHEFGKKVRTGLEKPYYTLNHILSTLKEEDFSEAWKVHKRGMVFSSTRGKWRPPAGLILFPVELEKYDFRRSDEILLLGFNKPITTDTNKFDISFSGKKSKGTRITDNSIKFGDVEFNTRSLIVTKDQWNDIQTKLERVTENDDISHTGFKTLNHMQEVLVKLSDKWLEVRLTAQEAAVNFLGGLLGSSQPIFMPRDGLETPSYPQLDGKIKQEEPDIDSEIQREES